MRAGSFSDTGGLLFGYTHVAYKHRRLFILDETVIHEFAFRIQGLCFSDTGGLLFGYRGLAFRIHVRVFKPCFKKSLSDTGGSLFGCISLN